MRGPRPRALARMRSPNLACQTPQTRMGAAVRIPATAAGRAAALAAATVPVPPGTKIPWTVHVARCLRHES